MSEEENLRSLNKLTVLELKSRCEKLGLATKGVKKDLILRLKKHEEAEEKRLLEESDNCIDDNKDKNLMEENADDLLNEEDHSKSNTDHDQSFKSIKKEDNINNDRTQVKEEEISEEIRLLQEPDDDKEDNGTKMMEVNTEEDNTKSNQDSSFESIKKEDDMNTDSTQEKEEEIPNIDDLMLIQPMSFNRYLTENYLHGKKQCTLYISDMSGEHVLCPEVVEWANRAMYFNINFKRVQKGAAIMIFSTESECAEALESLRASISESCKIEHPSFAIEKDIVRSLKFELDSELINNADTRCIVIENCPPDTLKNEIVGLFPDALAVLAWECHSRIAKCDGDYVALPENYHGSFLVEFGSSKQANGVLQDEEGDPKEYILHDHKLKLSSYKQYQADYRTAYMEYIVELRKLFKAEVAEKEKSAIEETTLTDEERLKLVKEFRELTRQRAIMSHKDTRAPGVWQAREVNSLKLSLKIHEKSSLIDGDTDRRLKAELLLPESVDTMTKYTKKAYLKLPYNLQEEMRKASRSIKDDSQRSINEIVIMGRKRRLGSHVDSISPMIGSIPPKVRALTKDGEAGTDASMGLNEEINSISRKKKKKKKNKGKDKEQAEDDTNKDQADVGDDASKGKSKGIVSLMDVNPSTSMGKSKGIVSLMDVEANTSMGMNRGMNRLMDFEGNTNMGMNRGMNNLMDAGPNTNMGMNRGMNNLMDAGPNTNMGMNRGMNNLTDAGPNPNMGMNRGMNNRMDAGPNPNMGMNSDFGMEQFNFRNNNSEFGPGDRDFEFQRRSEFGPSGPGMGYPAGDMGMDREAAFRAGLDRDNMGFQGPMPNNLSDIREMTQSLVSQVFQGGRNQQMNSPSQNFTRSRFEDQSSFRGGGNMYGGPENTDDRLARFRAGQM